MDILEMKFENSIFDGVLDAGTLFHFTKIEQIKILQRIYSILKLEGKIISFYPEGNYEGIQEIEIDGKKLKRYVNLKSIDKWIELFEQNKYEYKKEMTCNIGKFRCVLFSKIK